MKSVAELQKEIMDRINDPEEHVFLDVSKKNITREEYLSDVRCQCEENGIDPEDTNDLVEQVDRVLWGFGILDDMIADPDISDIRLIDENHIRIKKLGKRYPADVRFASKSEFERYIDFITSRNETSMSIVNAAQVFTDKDSCKTDILRFSLVSDLVNTNDHPTLLIRKIPKVKKTFDNLVEAGFCTEAQAQYLLKRWVDGHGILVDGPNGSGKTTLTNAILESTPHEKSCVVIQESEELFCEGHPEMVFRKVIPEKNGSSVSYTLRDLARLALMESFDCIVVGEIKGDEAAELSYATYTGSQSMTTVHSNSAREGIEKLIDYALDAQPNRTRDHFAKQFQSLDTLVFVSGYRIREIYEVKGWDPQKQEYTFVPARIDESMDGATAAAQRAALPNVPAPEAAPRQRVVRQAPVPEVVRPKAPVPLSAPVQRQAQAPIPMVAAPVAALTGRIVESAAPQSYVAATAGAASGDPFSVFGGGGES